jgi:hypothetical protein
MQSEKPKIAKKAEENKLFAKPVDRPGSFMAAKNKKDESIAAKLGNEPEEGVGSGIYSEFLHQWAVNVSAVYNPTSAEDGCLPVFNVELNAGHVAEAEPVRSCGPASDQAFASALRNAQKPPMPTTWQNQQILIVFYATGGGKH